MRVGVTGHRNLTPRTITLVSAAIEEHLAQHTNLIGITALAEGADQLFARVILSHRRDLEVIVPSAEYRSLREDLAEYDRLLARAARVTRLPFREDGPAAHMAAGLVMVERSDMVLAVWDSQPARAFAGTADVVEYARQVEIPVVIIWPPGATRP